MEHSPTDSPRTQRTRAAILGTFVRLVLERRYDAIRVSDLVSESGVGKSTFYEHFRSKDDVLVAAMHPVLLALATAASGRAARSYVRDIVAHLWERRSSGRPILSSGTTLVLQRRLAKMIRPHIERTNPDGSASSITATGIAAAQLAMLRSWLAGEASCSVDDMTDRIIACSMLIMPDRQHVPAGVRHRVSGPVRQEFGDDGQAGAISP